MKTFNVIITYRDEDLEFTVVNFEGQNEISGAKKYEVRLGTANVFVTKEQLRQMWDLLDRFL